MSKTVEEKIALLQGVLRKLINYNGDLGHETRKYLKAKLDEIDEVVKDESPS